MTKEQQQVKEFMLKAGQECPGKPCFPSIEIILLRQKLFLEELIVEFTEACLTRNITRLADCLADGKYVLEGAAVAFGIDLEPIFNEVHRSNMSKFIDGHKREDGKWIKGPSYSPANLKPIIDAQMK